MESALYALTSADGPHFAQHPSIPDRTVAYIYYDPTAAAEAVLQSDNPSRWQVTQVTELEAWLDSLLERDVTHVIEVLLPTHSTERTTAGWLLMLRAKQSGREYYRKPS